MQNHSLFDRLSAGLEFRTTAGLETGATSWLHEVERMHRAPSFPRFFAERVGKHETPFG